MQLFDNWYDGLLDVAETLQELDPKDTTRTTLSDNSEWAGASFDEALDMLEHGWSEERAEVEKDVEEVLEEVADRLNAKLESDFREVYDTGGGYVDIGRYLDGEPECMVEQWLDPAPKKGKVIKILNNCVVPGFVDEKVIRERGRAVCVAVEVLHRLGFNMEIWTGESVKGYVNGQSAMSVEMVKVKDAADPLDWDNIMFAMAHPAMLRQVVFGLNESRPDDQRDAFGFRQHSGYGHCVEFPEEIHNQFDVVLRSQNYSSFDRESFLKQILVVAEADRVEELEV